jgi:hypothetical protein
MAEQTWNVALEEDGLESAIVGHYELEECEGEDDECIITIIGSLRRNRSYGGWLWWLEDDYVGPVDSGWSKTKKQAIEDIFEATEKWEATEGREVQS